jgi:hypothetical protein
VLTVLRALAVVTGVLLTIGGSSAFAQTANGAWIVGAWEGKHNAPTIPEDATRFDFEADGEVIRWTMSRKGQIRLRRSDPGGSIVQNGTWKASGVVSRITDDAVELEGKYDESSFAGVVGRSIGYALEGYLIGAQNQRFPISLKRLK